MGDSSEVGKGTRPKRFEGVEVGGPITNVICLEDFFKVVIKFREISWDDLEAGVQMFFTMLVNWLSMQKKRKEVALLSAIFQRKQMSREVTITARPISSQVFRLYPWLEYSLGQVNPFMRAVPSFLRFLITLKFLFSTTVLSFATMRFAVCFGAG